MRKLLLGLLLVAACHKQTTTVTPSPRTTAVRTGPGADTPRAAVDAFLGAVRAQDLQAMSVIWGNKEGPVRDSKIIGRDELEKREVVLMRCFRHDSYRVLSDIPAADGERQLQVELKRGTVARTTDFFTARGGDRWFVRTANVDPVKEFCTGK